MRIVMRSGDALQINKYPDAETARKGIVALMQMNPGFQFYRIEPEGNHFRLIRLRIKRGTEQRETEVIDAELEDDN